ncbi:O-acyltransferase like protein-like [Brevipalpus obovatus]|uniref:O-acyltransferase like protein-like n=1 Tax=Brevipalpus obovatus TaxID=246614 RepID=UPI003D9E8889
MKSLKSGGLLIILILLHSRLGDSVVEVLFNKLLPWIEEKSFTKSFYLGSRISLLSLNSSLDNNNFTKFGSHSSALDRLSKVLNDNPISSRDLCPNHLQTIIERLKTNKRDTSILSFIDSFAKPVPGVRNGNVNWHGNQIQCESTNIPFESESKSPSNFGGKYCRAEWSTDIGSDQSFKHYTGICVPSTCTREDFEYMKAFLEEFFFLKISEGSQVIEISCTGDDKIRIDSIIFYLICLSVIFLGILSTIYDRRREKTSESKQKGLKLSIFSIFSIPRNWKSLDGQRVSKNDILIIHYIRGISAILVALSHIGGVLASKLITNPSVLFNSAGQSNNFWLLPRFIMAIFFFLTGFLIHSDYTSSNQDFSPSKSIIKAFARLSPSYYFIVFAQTSFISTIGLGPKLDFGDILFERNQCSKVFWANLLYIQNFWTLNETCVFVSWTLAVTFQLYIVGVLVVWSLLRSALLGLFLAIFLMIYGSFVSFRALYDAKLDYFVGLEKNLVSVEFFRGYTRDMLFFMDEFYVRTAVWLAPFMLGILFAYFLPKFQQTLHSRQKKSVIITSFVIISFYVIFCTVAGQEQSHGIYSTLQTIAPIGMGLTLSLLIFIFHPQSQFIDYKLSSKTSPSLVHLSRISYPLYLTHYLVLVAVLNGTSLTPTLDMFSVMCIIIGSLAMVYIASIFVYIFIERPIQNIRKIINI